MLLLAGDVNHSVVTLLPHIGMVCPPLPSGSGHDDLTSLHALVQDFQLCDLNTWTGGAQDYSIAGSCGSKSLIDLVLVRQQQVASLARQGCFIHDDLLDAGRHSD